MFRLCEDNPAFIRPQVQWSRTFPTVLECSTEGDLRTDLEKICEPEVKPVLVRGKERIYHDCKDSGSSGHGQTSATEQSKR